MRQVPGRERGWNLPNVGISQPASSTTVIETAPNFCSRMAAGIGWNPALNSEGRGDELEGVAWIL